MNTDKPKKSSYPPYKKIRAILLTTNLRGGKPKPNRKKYTTKQIALLSAFEFLLIHLQFKNSVQLKYFFRKILEVESLHYRVTVPSILYFWMSDAKPLTFKQPYNSSRESQELNHKPEPISNLVLHGCLRE